MVSDSNHAANSGHRCFLTKQGRRKASKKKKKKKKERKKEKERDSTHHTFWKCARVKLSSREHQQAVNETGSDLHSCALNASIVAFGYDGSFQSLISIVNIACNKIVVNQNVYQSLVETENDQRIGCTKCFVCLGFPAVGSCGRRK